MQISSISPYSAQQKNSTFKSAFPVFVKIGETVEKSAPLVGEKLNEEYMRKITRSLNDSFKREVNPKRDRFIDNLRVCFGKIVEDFRGRVAAFTCVDGGFDAGELKPYFYLLTGNDIASLNNLRQMHKDAVVASHGYRTANLKIAKDKYCSKGRNLVSKSFSQFNPYGRGPEAMFAYFTPVRNKNGAVIDYEFKTFNFLPIENPYLPALKLEKMK